MVKLDEEGLIQWMKVWGENCEEYYNYEALHITDEGILAWLTFNVCEPSVTKGYVISQIGLDGVTDWNKIYTVIDWRQRQKGSYYSLDSTLSTDRKFIVSGFIQYGNSRDAWLAKVDTNGIFLWNKTYGTTGRFNIVLTTVTPEDNVATTSNSSSRNASIRGFEMVPLYIGVIVLKKRKR